jgi:hypothetical protein
MNVSAQPLVWNFDRGKYLPRNDEGGPMARASMTLVVASCLALMAFAPGALAGNRATATMTTPNGCAGAVYSWMNVRKAALAHIEVRPEGVLLTTAHSGPVGPNGSLTLPAEITFVAGQHYTLFGYLTDSAGRNIMTTGAAWWGYC